MAALATPDLERTVRTAGCGKTGLLRTRRRLRMGAAVPPGRRTSNLLGKTVLRPDEKGGSARTRPEHVVGQFWHQTPEHSAYGRESGISAAIWGSRHDAPQEYK